MSKYLGTLKRHPACAAFLSVLAAFLVGDAVRRHALDKTVVYLAAVGLSVLAIDAVLARWPIASAVPHVRSPALETCFAAGTAVLGFACFWTLFVLHDLPASTVWRWLFLIVGLGSGFGVALALFLLWRGYRQRDLGVRANGLLFGLPIHVIFGILAFASRGGAVLNIIGNRSALIGWLTAMPVAGLSEEFLRFVWQTRVSAWRDSPALGWIVASCVWAAMHAPRFVGANGLVHGTLGVIDLMPLGLLFGYLTHRTRSFLPAALIHSTNIWLLHEL